MHCGGNEPSGQRQAGDRAGWHGRVGRSATGTPAACCAEFWECIVLLLWVWSTRTQVNLKPIITRVIWTLRIDKGDICRVIIASHASHHNATLELVPCSNTDTKSNIIRFLKPWKQQNTYERVQYSLHHINGNIISELTYHRSYYLFIIYHQSVEIGKCR